MYLLFSVRYCESMVVYMWDTKWYYFCTQGNYIYIKFSMCIYSYDYLCNSLQCQRSGRICRYQLEKFNAINVGLRLIRSKLHSRFTVYRVIRFYWQRRAASLLSRVSHWSDLRDLLSWLVQYTCFSLDRTLIRYS